MKQYTLIYISQEGNRRTYHFQADDFWTAVREALNHMMIFGIRDMASKIIQLGLTEEYYAVSHNVEGSDE